MSLWKLRQSLLAQKGLKGVKYRIPRSWRGGLQGSEEVSPHEYYLEVINEILARPAVPVEKKKAWTKDAFIYNLFIRAAASFDHDGDGKIGGSVEDGTCNESGLRETGTFLKALAMLPHIQRLGCDTVYLLPITAIGKANRKGLLGSPYAIRNPYVLDENLADPLLGDLSIDAQFAAFTEAAHHMGMKVVLEFVFRTSAQDGDWVAEHPEWYYWICHEIPDRSKEHPEGYGNPQFSDEDMAKIKEAGEDSRSGLVRTPAQVKEALDRGEGELIEPPKAYQNMFLGAPEKVELDDSNHWVGTMSDGKKARIPGAFADWPPDDVQPPWTDVTYLRMYGQPGEDFDYMAYNTIRLYSPKLAKKEKANEELWNHIASIVPSYQERFAIDGVMIDMGHALPVELAYRIQDRAREVDPGFAFWEEKFFLDPISPQTGYEAVVGPGIFTLSDAKSTAKYIFEFSEPETRFFATGENHNTPRLPARGGRAWTKQAFALALFLPASVPFIHNGLEVLETLPLNTGLEFSEKDLEELKDTPLGLFDATSFSWEEGGEEMIPFISSCFSIRRKHAALVSSYDMKTFHIPPKLPKGIIAYTRQLDDEPRLGIYANPTEDKKVVELPRAGVDLLSGEFWPRSCTVKKGDIKILEFQEPERSR